MDSRFPNRRRRHRHGRDQGTLMPPGLPGWRTRSEYFDELVGQIVGRMRERFPEVGTIEFAVEEVPPSIPAPWEPHDVCLARVFARDSGRALSDKIVIYRRPIGLRCRPAELPDFLRLLLAERISHVLALSPDDLIF